MDKDLSIVMKQRWEDLHAKERFQPKYPSEHVVRFIFTQFPRDVEERQQLRILDLGCGTGANTVFLAREGFQVYATDISEKGIEVTKKRLQDNNLHAVIKTADMENLPFPDNFFDAIVSFGVIYHTNQEGFKKAVSEVYRALEKEGKAFIYVRTTQDYRFGKGRIVEKNTFILDIEDTNEKGMIMHFLDRDEINEVFNKFSEINVEKSETTFYNLKEKNSEWIIKVKK